MEHDKGSLGALAPSECKWVPAQPMPLSPLAQGHSLTLSVYLCGGEGLLSQRYEAEVRIQIGSWLLAP